MSFGYAISDVITVGGLAYNVVQNSRKACGEHDELTREVSAFHAVLQRLEKEVEKPESLLNQPDSAGHGEELTNTVHSSKKILKLLDEILNRYSLLSDSERSAKKLWKKIRFGNGEMADVAEYREKLVFYTTSMALHLNLATVGTMGRVEKKMIDDGGLLREMKTSIDSITAHYMSKSRYEGSVLTTYTDDDKAVWKEFRRELIREGFRSADVKKNQSLIKAYVQELGKRGIFDDEDATEQHEPPATQDEHERIQNGNQQALNDDATHVSADHGTDKSETSQPSPVIIRLASQQHTSSSPAQRAPSARTPQHAYIEIISDSESIPDVVRDAESAISPASSGPTDPPCEIPTTLPQSDLTSTLSPSQRTRQTRNESEHADDSEVKTFLTTAPQEIELSEVNVKQLLEAYHIPPHKWDELATIDSNSIANANDETLTCHICQEITDFRESVSLLCGHFFCFSCFWSPMTKDIMEDCDIKSTWERRKCPCGANIIQYRPLSLQSLSLLETLVRSLRIIQVDPLRDDYEYRMNECNNTGCKQSDNGIRWTQRVDAIDWFIAEWRPFPMSQKRICRLCKTQYCALCNSKWRNYHCCHGQWQMLDSRPEWLQNPRPIGLLRDWFKNSTRDSPPIILGETPEWPSITARSGSAEANLFTSTYNAEQHETVLSRWEAIAAKRQLAYIDKASIGSSADWSETSNNLDFDYKSHPGFRPE